MNRFKLGDDAYFIEYYDNQLWIECMKINSMAIGRHDEIHYQGYVYNYDEKGERYICNEACEYTDKFDLELHNSYQLALEYLQCEVHRLQSKGV